MSTSNTDLDKVEQLQNLLIAFATGGGSREDAETYVQLRSDLLANPLIAEKLPDFVRKFRSLDRFWPFIKGAFGRCAERREFLWEQFAPALEAAEKVVPVAISVEGTLSKLSSQAVQDIWTKALERRVSDPASATTLARTLLESVCKHILDDADITYASNDSLPTLYREAAKTLNLAPSQHTEDAFKQTLGGCVSVVQGIGTIRSRIGDSHGQGRTQFRPAPRHAELVVNLAGAMATFLVATWESRGKS